MSRTTGWIPLLWIFWRADHYLECDELSYCDQRLQRNSLGFYRSDRGDISDRVDSPYDRDSTC